MTEISKFHLCELLGLGVPNRTCRKLEKVVTVDFKKTPCAEGAEQGPGQFPAGWPFAIRECFPKLVMELSCKFPRKGLRIGVCVCVCVCVCVPFVLQKLALCVQVLVQEFAGRGHEAKADSGAQCEAPQSSSGAGAPAPTTRKPGTSYINPGGLSLTKRPQKQPQPSLVV